MSGNGEYWKKRVDNLRSQVSLRSLVDFYKIDCQSDGKITQLHCPFHGKDNHASARLYTSNTMYCWVCSKSWDVISFTKDINRFEKVSEACKFLEDMYHIQKPDVTIVYQEPSFEEYLKETKAPEKEKDFERDFQKINRLILRSKSKLSLDQYTKYFYFYDNLYSNYKLNRYTGDLSLQLSLKNLHDEILKFS